MFNMFFVVALARFKSHCYFLFIYHVKNIGQVSAKLTYISKLVISCIGQWTNGLGLGLEIQ